jgi:hypothetical protein
MMNGGPTPALEKQPNGAPAALRPKPPYRAPCNRCGLCCMRKPCAIGKLMFKTDEGPCPALQWDPNGASACGLIRDPARYAPMRARIKGVTVLRDAMKLLVAAGKGCHVPSQGESIDKEWLERSRGSIEQGQKARKIWGIPNDETKSLIDRERLVRIFVHLGQKLTGTTWLCLIGSAPGILLGQPGRVSNDIDVWGPRSDYDEAELRRASREIGLEVYVGREKSGPDRDNYIQIVEKGVSARIMRRAYLQISRPGVVSLPEQFPVKILGEYGALQVVMPAPALLAAMKLARGNPQDMADVNWWVNEQVNWWVREPALDLDRIRAAIDTLPERAQRKAARRKIGYIIPRKMNAQRAMATGEAQGEKGVPAGAIPAAPDGVNAKGWQSIISAPPVAKSGKAWPYESWGAAIKDMVTDPSPEKDQFFDAKFGPAGLTAAKVRERLGIVNAAALAAQAEAHGVPAAASAAPASDQVAGN